MINLPANWPAPPNVHAFTTMRSGGVSQLPYDSNNIAFHVEDNPEAVSANRKLLKEHTGLDNEFIWLNQTHTTTCIIPEEDNNRDADAALTRQANTALVVMTADCVPIVLCNKKGTEIAAIHAGWRGLVGGIIENTLVKMQSPREELMAWIGPAICMQCYSVGQEVHQQFVQQYPFSESSFHPFEDRMQVDLSAICEQVLHSEGLAAAYQSKECTFENKNRYYSYRRASQTGRIATLIWFNDN